MRRALFVLGVIALSLLYLALPFIDRTLAALVRYAPEPRELAVPVAGVTREDVHTSWGAPRSGHRKHEGVDIFARRGTPVVAAAPGEVVRIGQNRLGGNVVWVAGGGARLYYYAHLDRFRSDLRVGQQVHAGETLGHVGTTGNARGTPPHLHFGVYPASTGFRAVDPVPLLRRKKSTPKNKSNAIGADALVRAADIEQPLG
jgi:murein DD-endopeptidase MepM/ murein hydrolase activator NlpD